ncbi:MAG: aspartate aminotransferase family protein, partial [Henriciella sp.]
TREKVARRVIELGFEVLGDPVLGLIAFRHPEHHAFAIYGELYRRGWFTSVTKEPPSLHLMLSPRHVDFIDEYLNDLELSLAAVASGQGAPVETSRLRYS